MKKSNLTKRKKKKQKKTSPWLYLFVLFVAFAASAGSSYFYLQEQIVFESSVMSDVKTMPHGASRKKQSEGPGRLYEERDSEHSVSGDKLFRKDASLVIVEDIIRKRVKQYGARLLDLYFDKEGIIYIDFSDEIKKKFSGDAIEELKIIAGLFKGIKTEIPGLKALKIIIEGREAESIGGHIDISKPIGRRLRNNSSEMPVGIFDSGVGGLTVMKEIVRRLPEENIVYLGDTARVPYGTRSPETVIKYSLENAKFLISRGIKILVVACNTSSSVSLTALRENVTVPVIGVVEPGASAAVAATKNRKVAVIGTETTINTGAYEKAINALDESIYVTGIACPLFVPLIEEGWLDGDVVALTAEKYLSSIRNNGADSLVLGCTHYPMLKSVISETVKIPLIDSAVETAKETQKVLKQNGLLRGNGAEGTREFYVTDAPGKFTDVGERFLGHEITNITKINLGGK